MSKNPDFKTLITPLRALLSEVGEYLLEAQSRLGDGSSGSTDEIVVEWKKKDDPVTEADRESERRLREGLLKLLPGSVFRGEESPWGQWGADELCWLVDPIDGTRSFISKQEGWSISVALMRGAPGEAKPVLGMIHIPLSGETYWAVRGGGAFKDGEPIKVSSIPASEADSCRIAVSPKHKKSVAPERRFITGGAAYKCVLAASGEVDAYLHATDATTGLYPKEWDVAAGLLILEEAGGVGTLLDGTPILFNKVEPRLTEYVLSNGKVHEALLGEYEYK